MDRPKSTITKEAQMSVSLEQLQTPGEGPCIWIGAISFEDRCTGSLVALQQLGISVKKIVTLHYPTRAIPEREDLHKRHERLKDFQHLSLKLTRSELGSPATVHPYRPSGILTELMHLMPELTSPRSHLLIDTTCLTKSHTVAVANWLCMMTTPRASVTLAYTRPKEYGSASTDLAQLRNWAEVVFSPCDLDLEPYRRDVCGVILLGHEGSRLRISLNRIFPRVALVVLPQNPNEHPMASPSRTANAELIAQIQQGELKDWRLLISPPSAVNTVYDSGPMFAQEAQKRWRRVVLFPYGPKPHILAATMAAQTHGRGKSWYCYAVPLNYDVGCTAGTGSTSWFKVAPESREHYE